jgi:transposase, IS30 family
MGTLVERTSRYLVPLPLPGGRDAAAVRGAVISPVREMPANLPKSITWDQGIEMAQHAALTPAPRRQPPLRRRSHRSTYRIARADNSPP